MSLVAIQFFSVKDQIRQITNGLTTLLYELIYLLFYMCKTLEDIFLRLAGIKNLNGGWLFDISNDTSMLNSFRPSYFFENSLIGNMFKLNFFKAEMTNAGKFFILMIALGFAIMFILFCVQIGKAMKGKKKQKTKDVFRNLIKTFAYMIMVPLLTLASIWLISNFFSILFQIVNKGLGGNATSLAEAMFKDFFEVPNTWKGTKETFSTIVSRWKWENGDLHYDNIHQSLFRFMHGLTSTGGEYAILIKFGTFRFLYAMIGGSLLVYSFFKLSLKATERIVKLTLLFYSAPLVIGTFPSKSGKEKFSAWKTQYIKSANEVLGFTLALLLYLLFLSLFNNALSTTVGINGFVKFLLRLVVMIAGGLMIEPLAKMLNEIFTA